MGILFRGKDMEECQGDGSCGECKDLKDYNPFEDLDDQTPFEDSEKEYMTKVIEEQAETIKQIPSIATYITGGHPMFHQLLEKMRDIHNAKNADYGDGKQLGNFMEAEDFGVEAWRGALVRLSDKYSRIKSLSKRLNQKGEVDSESFSDTLIDLANYALLTLVLYKEK